jgi:hypothetical protein
MKWCEACRSSRGAAKVTLNKDPAAPKPKEIARKMITRKALAETHFSARSRHRRYRLPVPRRHGAGAQGRARCRAAARPHGVLLRAERHDHGCLESGYEGKFQELPRTLKALEPFKDDMLQIGNLTHNTGRALLDGAGDHGRCCGIVPHRHSGEEVAGRNQERRFVRSDCGQRDRQQTRFPSLELGMEDARQAGDCDSGYSCAYTNNLAWRSETQPLPPTLDPRALFERLFGTGQPMTPEERARQAKYRRSILDFVTDDTHKLEPSLGPTDRRKLDEYLSAIREVERRSSAPKGQQADRSAHG